MNETIDVDITTLDVKTLKSLAYDGLRGIENCNKTITAIQRDLSIINAEIAKKEAEAQLATMQNQSDLEVKLVTNEECTNKCNGIDKVIEAPDRV